MEIDTLIKRARVLNTKFFATTDFSNLLSGSSSVVYWMSRDQRVSDNWALIYAKKAADENKSPLYVVFNLFSDYKKANHRQFDFMLKGLEEVSLVLDKLNIPFDVFVGKPQETLPSYLKSRNTGLLVTDFSPLKSGRKWRKDIASNSEFPVVEVDAHNIVPCWIASDKQEYAARTIRPKIMSKLGEYLIEFPKLTPHKYNAKTKNTFKTKNILDQLEFDVSVKPVKDIIPGSFVAIQKLNQFIDINLDKYAEFKNNPNADVLSVLSPYLHFGQISAQRVAIEVKNSNANQNSKDVFLEELIVRKELADNFCYHNSNYDSFQGFPDWAKKTLDKHSTDIREYVYTHDEFENAQTHDDLWNASQIQMVRTGKMHGYMRMYWAKKILEWSDTPQNAIKTAIYLNDKYELDGRDPNGYTGIAWSIGGVHDRPWFEREIFGLVRYMSKSGLEKKFDVQKYIDNFLNS